MPPFLNTGHSGLSTEEQYQALQDQGLTQNPWSTQHSTLYQIGGDPSNLGYDMDKLDSSKDTFKWMTFDQATTGKLGADQLLKGFGFTDIDDEMRAAVQGFDEQYGWKQSQMKQNMYQGVGQAMGQTGAALGQMREQAASLASQSGLRRGRGGRQSASIYDQYQQGLTGMRQQAQQGIEGLRHQWYDELTDTMTALKAGQEEL